MNRRESYRLSASSLISGEAENASTYYVYTENRGPLNVRLEPNGSIIGSLAYGEPVQVNSLENKNWALITFHYEHPENGMGDWDAFVNRRYLIPVKPEVLVEALESEENTSTGDPMTDINREFAAARDVEPYRITVRPARATSLVNMRWIPTETGMIILGYRATEELVVLKELEDYLQVQDPDTGTVGYIHKKFAAR